MHDAIDAMRTAFGRDREIPQRRLLGASMFMPGRVGSTSGIKVVSTTPGNPVGIVVVFDPETIQDHATFEKPQQYATGVVHVFVNGEQVLRDGEHTGATPGRVVHGPGRNHP